MTMLPRMNVSPIVAPSPARGASVSGSPIMRPSSTG